MTECYEEWNPVINYLMKKDDEYSKKMVSYIQARSTQILDSQMMKNTIFFDSLLKTLVDDDDFKDIKYHFTILDNEGEE